MAICEGETRQKGKCAAEKPANALGRFSTISFDVFCELEMHLEQSGFTTVGQRAVHAPGASGSGRLSLEGLVRKAMRSVFMRSGAVPGMMYSDHMGGELVIEALINECDVDSVRRMMAYYQCGDPMWDVLERRLKELTTDPDAGKNAMFGPSLQSNFYKTLEKTIKRKNYRKNSDFYNYAGISRQRFNKIKSENAVSRELALHLAVALELTYEEADQFLTEAGYSLKAMDRREAIISFIMRRPGYTFKQVEEALYLLGEKGFLES